MGAKLQKFVLGLLKDTKGDNDDALHLHLLLSSALVFSAAVHVFLFFFYLSVNQTPLLVTNVVSLCIYGITPLLMRKRWHTAVGLLFSVEVTGYTVVSIYLSGPGNYVILYFFLVLVLQVVVPYAQAWVRVAVGVLLWAAMLVSAVIGLSATPVVLLSVSQNKVLTVFNVHMALVGIVVELLIGDSIQKVIRDHRILQLNKYRSQAQTDALTGQFNRRYAEKLLPALPRDSQWVVAMLDIDDFKRVNDAYGHAAGDLVLVALAQKMHSCLRKTDVVIRWGGEEFLLLLRDVDADTGWQILEKMRQSIEEMEVRAGDHVLRITVSIGLAVFDGEDVDESIRACDARMYEGKLQGKNQVRA